MAQHLWQEMTLRIGRVRYCEACLAKQITSDPPAVWPHISPICPGDPEDGGRLVRRTRPLAPAGGDRVRERELELA